MDLLHNLVLGFGVALTPTNVLFCLIGALIGTLIGVLPGIGPVATHGHAAAGDLLCCRRSAR